jgi:anti-sigma factor RsiW
MTDLDPAELSALLDGELDPARGREVEALIAADPVLSAEFEQLKRADQRLKSLAEPAAFRPQIRWPAPEVRPVPAWLAPCLAVIGLAWAVGKLAPAMALALGVNAAALALFIVCLAPFALREARSDRPLVA